ncbi:hypothetical protein RDI58_029025 [Solanum bulbocastanum]|uniref:Uncharacterized protein n=1 Tax=Solanum bulbocastanum TaxID=147425 RepID=A0AAN8Y007_SOLBU
MVCCLTLQLHEFVYVLAEQDKKLVAYLDDIYEDSTCNRTIVEWVLTAKLAPADAFGARISGRSILRPSPMSNTGKMTWAVNIECIVDVWWHNGWWRKTRGIFGRGDLPHSQEWLGDGWRNLKGRPELVSALVAFKFNQVIDELCYNEQEQTSIFDGHELFDPCKNISNGIITRLVVGQEKKIKDP